MPYNAGYVSLGYKAGYDGPYTGGPLLTAPATITEGEVVTVTLKNITSITSATLQGASITLASAGGDDYTFTAPLQVDNDTAVLEVAVVDLESNPATVSVSIQYQNNLDLLLTQHGTAQPNSILNGVQFASSAPVEFEVTVDFDPAVVIVDWTAVSDNEEWLTDVDTLASFNVVGDGESTATLRYFVTDTGATGTFDVTVDTANAYVQSITLPTNGTYTLGGSNVLTFVLHFTEAVAITGTPRLVLNIGGITKYADFVSLANTTDATFSYTLESGLQDLDGIALTALQLNGGTITDTAIGADASLALPGSIDLSGVLVDTKVPNGTVDNQLVSVAQPAITGTVDDPNATISVSPGSVAATNNGDGTWTLAAGQITALSTGLNTVTATFTDQAGLFSSASGIIELEATNVVVVANDLTTLDSTPVVSGTVSQVGSIVKVTIQGVEYNATVSGTDWTAQITAPLPLGPSTLTANATSPNGTTDSATATITFQDVRAPAISSVIPPAGGIYTTGEDLEASVVFDETVVVTGAPRLPVMLGNTTVYLSYVSGTNSDTLLFRYTVQAGDEDLDGISLVSLQLNGGTIRDAAGNDAALAFAAVTSPNVIVLTEASVITVDAQTTINSAPIITGTSSQQNVVLSVLVDGVTYNPAVDENGNWSQQIGSLAVGSYEIIANAVNISGLVSDETTAMLIIQLPEEVSDPNEPDRLTDAILLLKRRLGRYTDNPTGLDEYILPELVAAQNRLENKTALPWFMKTRIDTIQTTPGQERIVKPNNWVRIREDWEIPVQIKVDGQWRKLGVYSYEQFWDNTSDTPGVPTACAQDGQDIVLGPPPAAVYPVRLGYYKREYKLVLNKVTSNAWLKYAFDLIVSEAGFILANNYLKNQEAAAQFAAEIQRAESDLRMTTIAYETAAMESWELNHGR